MSDRIVVGSRGSVLALSQTRLVIAALQAHYPEHDFTVQVIHTQGDRDQTSSLSVIGGQGAFVKEIEAALLSGDIDMAVHSLKDLPAAVHPDLSVRAVLTREDPRDALITRDGTALAQLPLAARVGTGSGRRAAQLRRLRPDLRVLDIRGNVDTRLRKLGTGEYDAIILAAAGLSRLNLQQRVSEYLTLDQMLPAPGQGILAVETRAQDEMRAALVAAIVDPATETAARAERAFLGRLGAGCSLPVAAYARVEGTQDLVTLQVMLANADGSGMVRAVDSSPLPQAVALGARLAERGLSLLGEAYASP